MNQITVLDEVLTLGKPAHGGFCVARSSSGKVILVRHGIPGEKVRVAITSERSKLAYGDAVEILEASPDRVPSIWPQAGPLGVGGGELAHISYPAQLRFKSEVFSDVVHRMGQGLLDSQLLFSSRGMLRSLPDYQQGRSRVEFTISPNGKPAMFKVASKELVELTSMPLAHESLEQLDIFSSRWDFKAGARLRAVLPNGCPPVLGIGKNYFSKPAKRASAHVKEQVNIDGMPASFHVRPRNFWQAHRSAASWLSTNVVQMLNNKIEAKVVELYSGSGLLSVALGLNMSPSSRLVTLESNNSAVTDARGNLDANNVKVKSRTLAGTVTTSSIFSLGDDIKNALLVLDPPRSGAGEKIINAISESSPLRILMVSCDPAAMVRDTSHICAQGYEIADVRVLDLFSHTHHFEILCLFERKK